VALARALAPDPDLVLLDEPFSALDTGLRARSAEVAATLRAAGTTSVLVTHDQVEAMTMADTVAVMRAGEIVQVGPPHELYRRPVDAWTAGFLGDAVLLTGRRVGDHQVDTVLGRLELAPDADHAPDGEPVVFLRPEQVQPASGGIDPVHNVDAVVVEVTFLGPDATVVLDVAGVRVPARWPSSLLPAVGDRTRIAVTGPVLAYPAGSSSGWAPAEDDRSDAATGHQLVGRHRLHVGHQVEPVGVGPAVVSGVAPRGGPPLQVPALEVHHQVGTHVGVAARHQEPEPPVADRAVPSPSTTSGAPSSLHPSSSTSTSPPGGEGPASTRSTRRVTRRDRIRPLPPAVDGSPNHRPWAE
jgi:hypothetical protein